MIASPDSDPARGAGPLQPTTNPGTAARVAPTSGRTTSDRTATFAEYGPWAIVTGAAAGVGLAFVEELHDMGFGVVMVDREPNLADIASRLTGPTMTVHADLSESSWADEVAGACAKVDVGLAVANAGIAHVGRFNEMTRDQRQKLIEVNCLATAELAALTLPAMVERGRGGFVATSSGSALAGTAGVALYSATKAFSVNLVEALGHELRSSGVHALAVIAPTMDTPGFAASGADPTRMLAPAIDPRVVVRGALAALPQGGRWLADPGLQFVANVERDQRVAMLSEATMAMYPDRFS